MIISFGAVLFVVPLLIVHTHQISTDITTNEAIKCDFRLTFTVFTAVFTAVFTTVLGLIWVYFDEQCFALPVSTPPKCTRHKVHSCLWAYCIYDISFPRSRYLQKDGRFENPFDKGRSANWKAAVKAALSAEGPVRSKRSNLV